MVNYQNETNNEQRKYQCISRNIYPKKFLYSDHEIFLRELISNATDATTKLKHLIAIGEVKVEYRSPQIEIKVDKDNQKIHITDQGLGMTADEVEKYINQIAFEPKNLENTKTKK